MPLCFSDESRYYDAAPHAVRFWGHDGAMEASFFVGENALKQTEPGTDVDEGGFLGAVNLNGGRTHPTATKIYGRGPKGSCDLGPPTSERVSP